MSSILKEPYQISIWEDELIPEIVEYYKKTEEGKIETIASEEYEQKTDEEKKDYTQKIIREHFEESRGLIIGANDMDSPYAAVNSSLKTNVNGSANLTFTMYYKVFDPDEMDFVINPLAAAVLNERKIKLHFRGKWYDMVIKNCVEDSAAYSFTYTCSDIYINELSKNGFKVELDTELENNQGTVTKVGETILEGTDWHVAPIEEEAPEGYEGPYSDVIVQTNIEPIYQGILNQTITVEPVNDFTPDEYADMSDQSGYDIDKETGKKTKTSFTIPKGEVVFMFYSDITKNAEQPQILYRNGVELPEDLTDKEELSKALQKVYARDINEDIITNAYNYRVISPEVLYVDKASSYDVPNIFYSENDSSFEICDWARGEKVIRSTKTGYDPDLDQFITVYKKYNEETDNYDYYYGYTTLDSISSDLAMNYLANSDNFIGLDTGWIFDGTPTTMDDAGDGTTVTGTNPNSEDATFTGQIYLLNQEGFSYDAANEGGAESVLIMKLEDGGQDENGTPHYYRDNNGDFYKIIEQVKKDDNSGKTESKEQYIKIGSPKAKSYEAQIAADYKRLRTKGDERFASMSDDELQRTIDSALRNARYSTRIRRAVNTGIAANRKQIENFSESEEYIFAVSLGQYKEGEPIPEYGHEIKYGAKAPTELYTFEDVTDSEAILKKVREEAYTQAVAEIKNHPTRYLNTDEYGNITDEIYLKVYNDYLAEKEAEYTAIYLDDFGLLKNLMHQVTIDVGKRGGKRFRNIFKENLLSTKTDEVEDPERFVNKVIQLLTDCKNLETEGKDFAQYLFEKLQQPFFLKGWAIAEEAKIAAEEKGENGTAAEKFEWLFIENSWEQSGNDGTFPEYKEDSLMFTDDSEINSFCDMLYVELIKTIYDRYITATFDTDNDGTLDDPTITVIIPTQGEIMQIVDDVFEDLVDRVGLIGALKAAYEYKKPSILNSKGGDKYQQHRARWERDGHEVALYAALHSEPFAPKYSYGTPELDKDGKVVQDDKKTTDENEFGGKDEVEYLTVIEELRIKIKKELDEKSSPAYINTNEYYEKLDTSYEQLQKQKIYYKNEGNKEIYISELEYAKLSEEEQAKWIEKTFNSDQICGWGFTSLYLKYKEAEFNEAAQVATFTISREEYPLNSSTNGEMTSPIVPKQDDDGNWNINNTYKTTAEEAKYFAYEDDVNGYYIFDKETEKIRLYNPTTDREKPTYLPIKDDKGGNYIYDVEREVYRRYRGWLSTEYRDPKTGEYLSQAQGGLAGDIIRHDMAWFDGHIGEWDEIPTRYQMVRTYEDEEDRLYLDKDVTVEWNIIAKPTGWQKFQEIFDFDSDFVVDTRQHPIKHTYLAGHQLEYFYEDKDGYYVREEISGAGSEAETKLKEFNANVKDFFENLGDDLKESWTKFTQWLGFGEVKKEEASTFALKPIDTKNKVLNALLWGYNELIVPVVNLAEDGLKQMKELATKEAIEEDEVGKPFTNFLESKFFKTYENIVQPLAERLGIKVSEIGIFSSNEDSDEATHFENQPYFIQIAHNGIQFTIPNLTNAEVFYKAIQSDSWEANSADNPVSLSDDNSTLPDFYINKGQEDGKDYNINDTGSVQYVKYRWWNWRHWGRKRYNLKEKLCVPAKNGSLDEFKVYNSVRDGASKNYSVVPVDKKPERIKYTAASKSEAINVAKIAFEDALTTKIDAFWTEIAKGMSYWQRTDDPLIYEHEFEELDWWKRDWDILSNLSISYLVKYRFCIATGACWGVYKNGYITSLPDRRIPGFGTFESTYKENGTTKTETKEITTDVYVEHFKAYIESIEPTIIDEKETEIKEYKYSTPNPPHLGSSNFLISEGREINEGFYLKEKTIAYRTLQESDFEPDTYFMWYDEEIEDTHYTYNSYLNYFKPYDKKDREIELGDGHFGLWVQTFTPIPALNQPLETKIAQVFDKHGVFLRYLDERGYNSDTEEIKEATYDSTWLPVDNILIPYEKRLYNAGKRHFRRVRSTSSYSSLDEHLDDLFTYCNGEYMSLREYYEKNTKISHLDYNGLKVYFTPHYKYNPEHFSLEVNQEPYDEYLGLQIKTEPEGYFDTTVLNNTIIEEEVKERWGYWKIGVNKGYSLTDDLLSSIGIVFEKAIDAKRPVDKNGNDEDFAFLGMQLFRYIPYRSNKRKEEISIVENGTLTFTKTTDTGYWDLVPSGDKLKELKEDVVLPEVKDDIPIDVNLELAAKEFFEYLSEGIGKTEYIVSYLDAHEGDNTQEFIFEYILEKVSLTEERRPIIPGETPDARDLTLTEYYIYDPEREENDKPETAIFDYKGQYPEEAGYEVVYDELCQKIRSIKGKEQNYFKLLQDCCDTFDCWMEVIVDHDPETGRVEYEERKVYTKISDEVDPQQYFDTLPEGEEETDYTVEYMIVPKKTIRFKRFVGKKNWSGFKYGVNLKHVKRTLDSNKIATRIIVKPNKNEFATDGFCTIQRADENFIKENFIYDFSYYINKKMLDYGQVLQDLYTDVGSNLGYYRKLGRLNKENDQLIIDIASVIVELDKVKADYETAVLGRDAANEEIQKLMQILTSNYDTYGNIQFVPWEYNRAKEYEQKTSTTAPERPGVIIDGPDGQYVVDIPAITTELEYPKYNETLRTYFDQMDTYMRSHINFSKQVEEFGKRKQELEEKRDKLLTLEQEIIAKKKELNKIFFIKYARFIQEGSWVDEKYMDDNLYYLDSLAVLRNSCSPKVTYDIGVIDLYAAVEFEEDRPVLEFELGDRTYVEDVEFFGYAKNDKPYQEQIVISEKIYMLDDASQNQIKVKNYSTQFDNLFQRAAAATQTLQFNEGSYGRASTILNSDGTINQNVLQQSVSDANLILANSLNENVLWDNTGITVTSYSQRSNVIKIVSAGIMLSKDGGNSYLTAITGDGVNAAVITGGMLNVDKLMIGASSTPNFLWNRAGISAFKTSDEGIDYSTFVRLDQYGIYGIKDWSKNDIPINKMTINDTFEPLKLEDITNNNNAIFGLTWDGFFLNTVTEQGRGRVTIGTNQDFRMSVFDEDIGWQDRVIIGSMNDILTGEKTYGFRLVNADGEIVMDTNLRGELYLKRKLRISNFANETSYNPGLSYDENGNVQYNPEQVYSSNTDDRVTLGIVNIYERTGEGTFTPVEPEGVYKSSQYLTKVLSIKVNDIIGNEIFAQDQIDQLIASNETFAIFDNGNLYAKNAWIEGHINATSGSFKGHIEAGSGTFKGHIEAASGNIGNLMINADGTLQTEDFSLVYNTGWKISDDTSYLNNVVFKGSIKASSLEYSETQVVGGALLLRPSSTIKNYYFTTINEFVTNENEVVEQNEDDTKYLAVILNSDCPFEENKYCKINSNMFNGNEKIDELDSKHSYIFEILKTKMTTSYEDSKEGHERVSTSQTVLLLRLSDTEENLNKYQNFLSGIVGATIIDIGLFEDSEREIGISLNSAKDEYGYFLPQTITMFETYVQNSGYNDNEVFGTPYEWKIENKLILGRFPDEDVNNPYSVFYGRGGYGLYADNVILNGAIIIKDIANDLSAGIDTKSNFELSEIIDVDAYQNLEDTQLGKVILWAGGNQHGPNSDTPFMVDEYGTIIAKNGIFEGYIYGSTIESSKLITAQIRGKDGEGELRGYSLEVFASQYGNETFWIGADYTTQDEQHFIQDYLCLNNGWLELNEVFGVYSAQAEHWGAETFDKILIGNYFADYSEDIYGEDVKGKIPNYNSHYCSLTIDEAGIGFNPRGENFDVWGSLTSIENLFFIGDSRYSSNIENIELLMGSNIKTTGNQTITKYMIGLGEDYLNLYGEVHFTTPNKAQDIKYVPVSGGYDIYIS